jgi:tetratricopeptide (TPR) repeat protein
MHMGRDVAAEQAQRQALLLAEQLASEFPADPLCRVALAVFRVNLAVVLTKLTRLQEAEACYRQALPIAEQLAREFPEEPIYQIRLAGVLHSWANLVRGLGHASQAQELYRRALVVFDKLATDHPANLSYKTRCAGVLRRLGELLLLDGNEVEAERALTRSVDVYEEGMRGYPKTVGYREEGAAAWESLGRLHHGAGRTEEAENAFRRSILLYEELLAQRPTIATYSVYLAGLFADCPVEALRNPPRAVEFAQKVLEVELHGSGHWVTLGIAHYRQGEWRAAVSALESGAGKYPPDTGRGLFYLAMSYARLGDQERAQSCYKQATEWMEMNQPRNPDLARWRVEAEEVLKILELLPRK